MPTRKLRKLISKYIQKYESNIHHVPFTLTLAFTYAPNTYTTVRRIDYEIAEFTVEDQINQIEGLISFFAKLGTNIYDDYCSMLTPKSCSYIRIYGC